MGRGLCGFGIVDGAGLRIFADTQQRRVIGDAAKRLPEQCVGYTGHRLSAAQALAVKRADHVV